MTPRKHGMTLKHGVELILTVAILTAAGLYGCARSHAEDKPAPAAPAALPPGTVVTIGAPPPQQHYQPEPPPLTASERADLKARIKAEEDCIAGYRTDALSVRHALYKEGCRQW